MHSSKAYNKLYTKTLICYSFPKLKIGRKFSSFSELIRIPLGHVSEGQKWRELLTL